MYRIVLGLVAPHWKKLIVALVAVLVQAAAGLLEPWPLKLVFDSVLGSKPVPHVIARAGEAFGGGPTSLLLVAVAGVLLIAIADSVGTYVEKYLTTDVGQHVLYDLRRLLYHHIQRLSLRYYEGQKTGDLVARVTGDVDAVQDFVSEGLLGMVVNALTLVGMLVVMFYLSVQFTLVALAVSPLLFWFIYRYTRRIKKAAREVRTREAEVAAVVEETVSSMQIVHAFGREDFEERRLARQSKANMALAMHARGIKARLVPTVNIVVAAGTCFVLWYGVRLVLAGELTPGSLLVFVAYLGKMYKPMRELSKMADSLSKAAVGLDRIGEVLEAELQVTDLPDACEAPPLHGRIEFDSVDFAYDDRLVLSDVNLRIAPGEVIALVGPTGSGKSTIAGLIPRFYDPISGSVTVDGHDIRAFTMKSLREQISFVLQDTVLFHGTIRSNIAYGKPDATEAEIVEAARIANAHEFIERMERGYDTLVADRGSTLSGGQRQRIAIARAVIRDTPILILDEPTSNLDAESEELVLEALDRLMLGRTTIIIAHRLSTIRRAGTIYVLDDGRIVESGTHEALISDSGLYARLYELQFRQPRAKEPDAIAPG